MSVKKVCKKVIDIVFVLAIIVALGIMISNYFGYQMRVVKSGSMEPEIKTGDIAIVNTNVPFDSVEVGDVVAFRIATGEMVTHRVIEIANVDGQKYFMTKGDNVEIADGYTTNIQNYYGKTIYSFPQLKFNDQMYLSDVLNSTSGKIFVCAGGLALIVLYIILTDTFNAEESMRLWFADHYSDELEEYGNYLLTENEKEQYRIVEKTLMSHYNERGLNKPEKPYKEKKRKKVEKEEVVEDDDSETYYAGDDDEMQDTPANDYDEAVENDDDNTVYQEPVKETEQPKEAEPKQEPETPKGSEQKQEPVKEPEKKQEKEQEIVEEKTSDKENEEEKFDFPNPFEEKKPNFNDNPFPNPFEKDTTKKA